MIDLKPFCATDSTRPHLAAPWSREKWTYATNGYIMIRVPRRDDVPENPQAPDGEEFFDKDHPLETVPPRTWHDVPPYKLERKPCKECDGKGYVKPCRHCRGTGSHSCDTCGCINGDCHKCSGNGWHSCAKTAVDAKPCEDCRGEGLGRVEGYADIMDGDRVLARLQGAYLELVKDLPGIQLGVYSNSDPVWLQFDGGEGLLMPCRL